jgi:hypothetical protein
MKWTTQTHVNCYRNPLGEFGFSQGAKNTTAYMVYQTLIQKSSAKHLAPRRIFPKVFRRSRFWTSFLSISQNFFDSCANSNRKNNKINLCNKRVKTRA